MQEIGDHRGVALDIHRATGAEGNQLRNLGTSKRFRATIFPCKLRDVWWALG
jgi:hypothetical protein